MTVTSLTNFVEYVGDGATTVFAYSFKIPLAVHLKVFKITIATSVSVLLAQGVDYTFTGIGADAGGTVTVSPAISSAFKLRIERVVPYTQLMDIPNQSPFFPTVLEDTLDSIVMMIQQITDVTNIVSGPASSTDLSIVLFDGVTGKVLKNGVGLGTAGQFLRSGGPGVAPAFADVTGAGSGDVVGPGSAIDRSIPLFSGTTGKLLKDSVALGTTGHPLLSAGVGADPAFGQVSTAGIATDAATNAILANMTAWTVKVRNAGTTGDPSDADSAALTTGAPASGDFVLGWESTGELRKFDVGAFPSSGGAPTGSSYVVVALDGTLTAERNLAVSAALSLTDGGVNAPITVGRAALTGDVTAPADSNVMTTVKATTTEVLTGTDAAKVVTADALAALWEKGANEASAATVSFGEGGFFHITGTTTITDIDWDTATNGRMVWAIFDGILTLTHNATTLKLPGGFNITTAAGDRALFVQDAADNVICLAYVRATSGWREYNMGTFALSTQYIQAHGLGTRYPSDFQVWLENTITEDGYAVGDRLNPDSFFDEGGANEGCSSWCTTANVGFSTGSQLPNIAPKAGGAAGVLTAANWDVIFRVLE